MTKGYTGDDILVQVLLAWAAVAASSSSCFSLIVT